MNILQITDGLPPAVLGGSGRIVWEISMGLTRKGHDVSILTCAKPGVFPAEKDGISIRTFPPLPPRFAHYRSVFSGRRAREILGHILAVKPDVIHAHLLAGQAGYAWIPLARKAGIPVIITCHDVMNIACGRVMPDDTQIWLKDLRRLRWSWNPFRARVIRQILMTHCTVLTVSDALRTWMEQFGYKNLQTVHNGVNLSFWEEKQSKHSVRAALGLPQDKTLFLLAGRLGIDKGIVPVNAALPKDAHLIAAGMLSEPIFDHLGDRLHRFNNQSAEEMRTLYTACDVSLVPSLCLDCFPTICLESMACERPVIGTTMGGARESVVEGKTGWILNPENTDDFRKKMQCCMDHPAETTAMGKAGRNHMKSHFSIEKMLETLEGIYTNHSGHR